MSSRHLKKVFGSPNKDLLLELEPDVEDEDDEPISQKNRNNAFAFLNRTSDVVDEEDKEDSAESGYSGNGKNRLTNGDNGGSESTSEQTAKKKRKRKKKKVQEDTQESGEKSSTLASVSVDKTIDVLKHDESLEQSLSSGENEIAKRAEFEKLFILEPRFMNPQQELKRIFGVQTVNSGRGKYSQRRVSRLCRLVSPKEHWTPTSGSGISMSFINGNSGLNCFKFNHSEPYQEVQKKFTMAVDSLNPDNIVSLLTVYPYHIDSRIQLSDLAKNAEDVQVAADLIEGAIYCMETSFDSRFSLTNSMCRLEYKYQENRDFHILLFKHLLFVGQRACYRTALELCKRLLLLDPDTDALCVTLMIDFYAVKSGEHQWLINVYEFWESSRNLSQLPNWAYSVALSKFLLSRESSKNKNRPFSKGQKASSAAEKKAARTDLVEVNSENDHGSSAASESDELLQYALLMFPTVLLPLLDKCGVHCETRVLAHPYFNKQPPGRARKTSPLKLLCDLYVWRCHYLWKDKDVMSWVERNVYTVLDKVDRKDPILTDYESKRCRRYLGTPRNILRHLILTDNKEHMGHIAVHLSNEPILNYDPLPPMNSINIYPARRRVPGTGSGPSRGFLSSLFRSLLQDLNAPQPNEQELQRQLHGVEEIRDGVLARVGAALPSNSAQAGLHQSVAVLLESMRDLLNNLRPNEADPQQNADDENENGDEDDETNID